MDDLVIWRDSVAAGDDADAPHEWRLPAPADASLAAGEPLPDRYGG